MPGAARAGAGGVPWLAEDVAQVPVGSPGSVFRALIVSVVFQSIGYLVVISSSVGACPLHSRNFFALKSHLSQSGWTLSAQVLGVRSIGPMTAGLLHPFTAQIVVMPFSPLRRQFQLHVRAARLPG